MATLLDRPFWVFDMDGTLTVPQHDFASFKAAHGLDPRLDVLAGIDAQPAERRAALHAAVRAWDEDLAARARPMDDALRLLQRLRGAGAALGILTRNTREGATITLRAAGLAQFFADPSLVLGRDCAPPKPAPDGITRLLDLWGARPDQAVMVGDWVFDIMAGRAAGTATVLVTRHGPIPEAWRSYADQVVDTLDGLR